MIWEELMIDRAMDHTVLRKALGEVFGVGTSGVGVIEDIRDILNFPEDTVPLVVHQVKIAGEYPLQLSLYLRGKQESRPALEVVRAISRTLQATCLAPDEAPDPETWIRVLPDGTAQRVRLKEEQLDRDEVFVSEVLGEYEKARRVA